MGLITELKRRNVFRVALLYLVASWLILQVADVLSSILPVPDWTGTFVFFLLLIASPFVLIFSWVYEITPEGIRLEKDVAQEESIAADTGRKINVLTMVMAAAAIAVIVVDRLIPEAHTPAPEDAPVEIAGAPAHSIAVLPFADMSEGKDQEYLADGLAEELLNLLAGIPDMRVAARTSSFSFKHEDAAIPAVAEKLNVAYVLEGSVRTSGDRIRVTAKLVNATDGYHVWSNKYERPLDDIFAIQDEIAGAVVDALSITLLGKRSKPREVDPEAYSLFLQGRYFGNHSTTESFDRAILVLEQALEIDPSYAPAWAELARVYTNKTINRLIPMDEGSGLARVHLERAISLDPEYAIAYSRLGWGVMQFEGDLDEAADLMSKAHELEPSNDIVLLNAGALMSVLGKLDLAIEIHERALLRDPLSPTLNMNTALLYMSASRPADAEALLSKTLALSPNYMGAAMQLARVLNTMGRTEEALEVLELEQVEFMRLAGIAIVSFEQGQKAQSDAALQRIVDEYAAVAAPVIGVVHAVRGEFDEAFTWLDRGYQAYGPRSLLSAMVAPELVELHADPRWDAMLAKVGISDEQLESIEFDLTPLP